MKRLVVVGVLCLLVGIGPAFVRSQPVNQHAMICDDRSTALYLNALGQYMRHSSSSIPIQGDSPIGEILWQYFVSGGSDNSPKAIHSIPDITGDGVDDVIVCSEDYYVRCLDGVTGTMVWQHEIYPGPVYLPDGLGIIMDVNNDGYSDVVVGATGGSRLIQCISGLTGQTIWTHDTHEYGGGGWVYQVDCRCDYNNDGVSDVLAATGDDGTGTGPQRIYCLNGLTGLSIWERPLGGPGFAVKSIADFNGDGQADVLVGCSNDDESTGYVKALSGATGSIVWSFTVPGSSVWAIQQIDDITGDGIADVAAGDFLGSGNIYGLNAVNGAQVYHTVIGSVMILRLERIGDVNNDGYGDLVPAHTNAQAMVLSGLTGQPIWTHAVADQAWQAASCSDISGDGVDDVLVGTLYTQNYVYFFDGVSGTQLFSANYGEALDALAAIPDINGDGSMEMVAGGRNGKVTCFSGGPNASGSVPRLSADFSADVREGFVPLVVQFADMSVAENTSITSWQWDFQGDGVVDSLVQNPVWTYPSAGVFTVSLTVSDGVRHDTETKEGYITVHAVPRVLGVSSVVGGLGKVSVHLTNSGSDVLGNVSWSVSLSGGFLLGHRDFSGLTSIAGNGSSVVVAKPVFGFGSVSVVVQASASGVAPVETTKGGFVLVVWVIIR